MISQTGKVRDEELCNRYFTKLSGDLGRKLHKNWEELYGKIPKLGIGSRIMFVFDELEKCCREATLQEQIKRLAWAFCRTAIYTPQAYGYHKPRKYLRKSKKFNEYKKDRYIKRRKPNRKCHCFICGDPNHLANRCPNRQNNIQRSNLVDEIGEYEIEPVHEEDFNDNESVYSILTDNEEGSSLNNITYILVNKDKEI